MTIETHTPELEELIAERMQSGAFRDVDDLLIHAIKSTPVNTPVEYKRPPGKKSLVEVFAPLRGLELDFERSHDTLRDIDL
jgi:hypothetical protein